MNYAVIFRYSFDAEVVVYLFKEFEDAVKFLKDNYEHELKIDVEENGYDCESEISEDGDYAKIVSHFVDRDDITEFMIGNIYR